MRAVALVRPASCGRGFALALAPALRAAGHRVVEIDPRPGVLDGVLRARKLGDELGRVPSGLLALRAARCPVAHAFAPADALAATLWSAHGGGAAVVTIGAVPRREEIAARRLRLATLIRALERSTAVVATGPEVHAGLQRWFGVHAHVIPPEPLDDAVAAYAELYGRLGRS